MIRRDAGFSLIEVLVAFAILAMSSIAILQSVGLSSRSAARSLARTDAVRDAKNLLVQATVSPLPRDGHLEGSSPDGNAWTIDIETRGDLVFIRMRLIDRFGHSIELEMVRQQSELWISQ